MGARQPPKQQRLPSCSACACCPGVAVQTDRVAVRGATLVLAVAPPDAPGRILLDASGLSPDAGEAFAATVFAAAEAPRGRVIP